MQYESATSHAQAPVLCLTAVRLLPEPCFQAAQASLQSSHSSILFSQFVCNCAMLFIIGDLLVFSPLALCVARTSQVVDPSARPPCRRVAAVAIALPET